VESGGKRDEEISGNWSSRGEQRRRQEAKKEVTRLVRVTADVFGGEEEDKGGRGTVNSRVNGGCEDLHSKGEGGNEKGGTKKWLKEKAERKERKK